MFLFRAIFFFLFATLSVFGASASSHLSEVTIGIQSYLDKGVAYSRWQKTADYLSRKNPSYIFNIVVVDTPDDSLLYQMVENRKVDYIITQPISAIELNRLYGTRIELTKNDQKDIKQLGGVIFTSSNNRAINDIESLKGNSFAASTPQRQNGWAVGC